MKELVEVMAKYSCNRSLCSSSGGGDNRYNNGAFVLHVASEDMGKVIGKQGRISKAIRTVMKAVATRENVKVIVEII